MTTPASTQRVSPSNLRTPRTVYAVRGVSGVWGGYPLLLPKQKLQKRFYVSIHLAVFSEIVQGCVATLNGEIETYRFR